eukprot:351806-Chlamydomonas_euryale.AAC.4
MSRLAYVLSGTAARPWGPSLSTDDTNHEVSAVPGTVCRGQQLCKQLNIAETSQLILISTCLVPETRAYPLRIRFLYIKESVVTQDCMGQSALDIDNAQAHTHAGKQLGCSLSLSTPITLLAAWAKLTLDPPISP